MKDLSLSNDSRAHSRKDRQTKSAVFQISRCDGWVRLIVVEVRSLRAALDIEAAARRRLPANWCLTFIGRFDAIENVTNIAQFVANLPDSNFITLKPVVRAPYFQTGGRELEQRITKGT
jgi:hypothetical protein